MPAIDTMNAISGNGNPDFLSQSNDTITGQMLSQQPQFSQPDTASLVSPPASEIAQSSGSVPLSGEYATARSGRYTFASQNLPDQDYDKGLFTGKIINGQDDDLRKQYAAYDAMAKDNLNDADTKLILNTKLPGEAVSPDEMARIQQNSQPTYSDPKTVFERRFAEQAITTATTQPKIDADHTVIDAQNASPDDTTLTLNFAKQAVARQQYAIKKLEEVQDAQKKQGYFNTAIDYGVSLIPFADDVITYNAFNQSGGQVLLPGSDMKATSDLYYTMPEGEYATSLDGVVSKMSANSLMATADFLQKLVSYSSSDEFWGNYVNPAIDLSVAAPGLFIKAPASAMGKLAVNLKNTTKAVAAPAVTSEQALSALGEVTETGFKNAVKLADEASGNAPRLSTLPAIDTEAQTIFKPEATIGGPVTSNSRPLAQRVGVMLQQSAQKVYEDLLGTRLNVDRVTGLSADAAVKQTEDIMRVQYAYANDSIIDIKPSTQPKSIANVDFVEAHMGENINPPMPMPAGATNPKLAHPNEYVDVVVGKTNAQFFNTAESGDNYAKSRLELAPNSYRIEQLGDNKYSIVVTKPIDETATDVRSALDIQTQNATPQAITNMYLGWARGRSYVIPKELYGDSLVSTYGASALQKMAKALYQPVGKMGKREYNQWIKFLEAQRDYTHPVTGQRGVWSPNLGALERDWQAKFGTMPSDRQVMAYYAHAQMNDIDWVIRNLSVYTAKSRKGIENFALDKLETAATPIVEGKFLKELPLDSSERFNFFILDDTTKNTQKGLLNSQFMRDDAKRGGMTVAEKKAEIRQQIADGRYKVIQLTTDGERALKEHPDFKEMLDERHIDYLVVNSAKSQPLGLKHVPYKPGGHVEFTNGSWFLRQPEIRLQGTGVNRSRTYTGDKTVLAFDTGAKAKKWLPKYEEARAIYAEVKRGLRPEADLKAYLAKELPEDLGEFKNLFAKDGAGLNINQKFYVTPKGRSVDDVHNLANLYKDDPAGFINRPRSMHRLMGPEDVVRYTGERDSPLLSVAERGTTANPIINFKRASLLDPASTMDQAIGSLMRGRYFDDIKYKFAEHFLSEFGDVLEPSFRQNIRDPFEGLINAKFKTGFEDRARLAAAQNYRRSVSQLIGIKSDGQKDFDWLRQKVADSIYSNFGDEKLDLVAPYLLHRSVDASGLLKQFGFHSKLGLFNPKQIFVQAAGVVHVAAVEGLPRALNAMGGGYMMSAAHFARDAAVLDGLADRMVALGWKKSDWLEAYHGLERSGFAKVGREVALQDGLLSPRLRDSAVGKVLDMGTVPFNIGERATRYTAWNAAYLRWRALNPGKTFNDKAIKEVLQRADLLTVNMSSAGNATWQYGLKGIPTQFFGYRARLMEQFLGKQLTVPEKAHAFLTYSLAFGLPVATTIPAAIWPVNNVIKEWMQSAGFNPDENIVSKIAMEGLGSVVLQSIFGEDTNFETAIGPGPITQFHDLWQQKKDISEILGGVSGSVFADIYASTTPFLAAVWNSLTDVKGPTNHITTQDMVDLVQPYATASNAVKAVIAYNWGVFYSKNQSVLVHVDNNVGAAVLKGVLGLDPQSLEDSYAKVENIEAIKDVKKRQEKEATKYYRLGFEALAAKSTAEATEYFERAGSAMDLGAFTPVERSQVMRRVTNQYQSTIQSIDWEFAKTSDTAMQAYRRKQQLEQGKK